MFIEVSTQFYTNKSDTNTPYWSPKGERIINLQVDRADRMNVVYSDNLGELVEAHVNKLNDEFNKFEILDWTVRFSKPFVLDFNMEVGS